MPLAILLIQAWLYLPGSADCTFNAAPHLPPERLSPHTKQPAAPSRLGPHHSCRVPFYPSPGSLAPFCPMHYRVCRTILPPPSPVARCAYLAACHTATATRYQGPMHQLGFGRTNAYHTPAGNTRGGNIPVVDDARFCLKNARDCALYRHVNVSHTNYYPCGGRRTRLAPHHGAGRGGHGQFAFTPRALPTVGVERTIPSSGCLPPLHLALRRHPCAAWTTQHALQARLHGVWWLVRASFRLLYY